MTALDRARAALDNAFPATGEPLDFVEFVKAITGSRYQWVRQEDAIDMAVSAAYCYQKATGAQFQAGGQLVEVGHSLGKMRRLVKDLGALDDELELTMPRPWPPLNLNGWPHTVEALREYVRAAMVIAVQEVNRESLLGRERDQVAHRVGDMVAAQLGISPPASEAGSGAADEVIERAERADALVPSLDEYRAAARFWHDTCMELAAERDRLRAATQPVPSEPPAATGAAAMVAEFHEAFGEPFGHNGGRTNELRARLHLEENRELVEALLDGDRVQIAHELADVVYVAYGSAHSLGIPLDAVIAEVHAANMRKMGPDGKPVLREDGKVLKPEGWQPADVAGVLERGAAQPAPLCPERSPHTGLECLREGGHDGYHQHDWVRWHSRRPDPDLAGAEQLIEDWLAERPAELYVAGGGPKFAFTPEELVRMVAGVLSAVRDTES